MQIFYSIKKKFKDLKSIKKYNIWDTEDYRNHIKKKFKKKLNHNYFFSVLNILNFYYQKKKILILDIGGGAGEYYYKKFFQKNNNHKIVILDNKKITNLGIKKYKKLKKVRFINNLNELKNKKISFLLFSSVAQYFEKINSEIKKYLYLNPDFIILEDFHASKNKSFVTYQKFFKYKIPVKFHEINKIIIFLKKNNYELIYKSAFLPLIKGKFQFYNMSNFPKANRLNNTYNLLFARIKN